MALKTFEVLEHTADIRLRVWGRTLKELFTHAAEAMFTLSTEAKVTPRHPRITLTVIQHAQTRDELLVNWLNELLSLSAVKGLIFSTFVLRRLTTTKLVARVSGRSVREYRVHTEIKAATYHQLSIIRNRSGWQLEVILDV